MKSMRSLYKELFHYVPDKRILAYFSMALSAAAVCSYMGAYWFLWQSIVSILVIPVYEKALIQGKTVIVISHRLKSIENADKIVVMKAGTVEACGKHAHLLKQSPTYRKMIEKSNLAEKFNY